MARRAAPRPDLAGPERHVPRKYRVRVDGVFHIKINRQPPATRDIRAIALDHHDIIAIAREMLKGFA